jgi:hypothetical protein
MTLIENRYLALQLATQLPRDRAEARAVISELRGLVDGWLFDEAQPASRLRGDDSKVVAILTGSPEVIPKKI